MSSAWDGLTNDQTKTELPHYAVNKDLPADSYFTSSDTAKRCMSIVNKVLPDEEYTYVEPAAGEGAFYDLFPSDRKVGIELHDRKREEFIRSDFLTWYPELKRLNFFNYLQTITVQEKKYVVVGNPPFGVRGAIALAFINRSLLFADYVAFILPMSFHSNGKGSNMKRVQNGHLIHSGILENESFFSPDTNKYIKINSLFQVWKRGVGKSLFPTIDVSEFANIYTVCSSPDRLCGLDKIAVKEIRKLLEEVEQRLVLVEEEEKALEVEEEEEEEEEDKTKLLEDKTIVGKNRKVLNEFLTYLRAIRQCDNNSKYDFYVSSTFFGNSLHTVYSFDDVKYGSGYGVILKKCKNKIMEQIKNVEWNNYSSLATNSCKHIRKHSIEKCFYDLGFGQEKT